MSFVVSAPGKVIIFGEHAAVFGKPAIAAAVSLRTYLLISKSEDPECIELDFPDIKFDHKWSHSEFPWEELRKYTGSNPTDELIPEITSLLSSSVLSGIKSNLHYAAAYAFCYLFTCMCPTVKGIKFSVKSTLPIGAGLGSSASIAVCLAAAFAVLGNHITKDAPVAVDGLCTENKDSEFIDAWAFMGEKCMHGNPSGIDNAVATHGGAVMFQRNTSSQPSVRTVMRNFPSLKLMLSNTKQSRSTATLVAGVTSLINEFPNTCGHMLDAIEGLTREGYNLMIRPTLDAEGKKRLRELFRINHGLLVAFGVSHPTLEKIKYHCDTFKVGETKLTGAGGGGCAITLVDETVPEETITELKQALEADGFETFETNLGGKGVGILHRDINESEFVAWSANQVIQSIGVENGSDWRFW